MLAILSKIGGVWKAGKVVVSLVRPSNFRRVKREVEEAYKATEHLVQIAGTLDDEVKKTVVEIRQAVVALLAYVQGDDIDYELARRGLLRPENR